MQRHKNRIEKMMKKIHQRMRKLQKEDCTKTVQQFLTDVMLLEVDEKDILVAHRTGAVRNGKPRLMVVKCMPNLKASILKNSKVLAKKINLLGDEYYINQQFPEAIVARRKENAYTIKKLKAQNKGKPAKLRTQFHIKNRQLFVDGYRQDKLIKPPCVTDLSVDLAEQEKMEKLKLWYSETKQENGNIFVAIGAIVSSSGEIRHAYRRIRQIYPNAAHVSVGFDCMKQQGNQDDGEHSAGLTIQKLIEQSGNNNRAVFVVRIASGNKIGPTRFKLISEVTVDVLAKLK